MNNEKIAVIGLGYVGLPLALLAKEKGYEVVGIDLSKEKVDLINKQVSPIDDEALDKWLKKVPLNASTDINEVEGSSIVLICVPTPVKNHTEPDLGPVKGAVEAVAKEMNKNTLLIIESTINPGVCNDTVIPIVKKVTGFSDKDIHVAHCPERINPGDPNFSVRNINRVVGGNTNESRDRAIEFYKDIIDADIKPMNSLKEAEAVKVVENSFRDVNIAFVNELAMSFHKLGIDVENVIDGAATKPFAFMPHRPGVGVGGHCIPVDPYYLIKYAKGYDFDHRFLSLARKINSNMPKFTVDLFFEGLNLKKLKPSSTTVAVLGIAYKPDVDDDRESPAYEIIELLEKTGVNVVSYDPHVLRKSSVKSLKQALKQSNAVVVVTGHAEFKAITPKTFSDNSIEVVIDGRNIYRHLVNEFKDSGIIYSGIGVS